MPAIDQVVVWVIVGLIGGSLASVVTTWSRRGYGAFRNLGLGLVGALAGGGVFKWLGVLTALDGISISLRDVVAAFVGSLIVLLLIWLSQAIGRRESLG